VRLREALAEDVLELLHDVVHVDGDQTAVLLQGLFKDTLMEDIKTTSNETGPPAAPTSQQAEAQ